MQRTAVAIASVAVALSVFAAVSAVPDDESFQALQTLVQQQTATILSLQARLDAQEKIIADMREKETGFHVDFGREPFHEINLTKAEPILFNRVLVNVGHGYNPDSGIFTAPYTGLYGFSLHIMAGMSGASSVDVGIFTASGAQAIAFAEDRETDTSDQGSCTVILRLQEGDEVSAQYHSGDAFLWGSFLTSFTGVLIHAE